MLEDRLQTLIPVGVLESSHGVSVTRLRGHPHCAFQPAEVGKSDMKPRGTYYLAPPRAVREIH